MEADTDCDGNLEYLEIYFHMKAVLRGVKDDVEKQKSLNQAINLFYRIIDCKNNGFISHEDFQDYFHSLDITDTKFTSDLFKQLTFHNHNFSITKEG